MREYRLAADLSVIELLDRAKPRERAELLASFHAILHEPNQRGDWRTRDASGREMEVKIFGRGQVMFWVDSPVWEVRVTQVVRIALQS